jgi:rubrerythrin
MALEPGRSQARRYLQGTQRSPSRRKDDRGVRSSSIISNELLGLENPMAAVFKSANPFPVDAEKYWTIFAPPLVQSLRILENSHVLGKSGGFMSIKSNLPEWWRRWFGGSAKGYYGVLRILRSRYAAERQRAARFTQHAQKMQDPQFREALLRIAADESRHGDWIAEKINEIGGSLPPELTISSTERNSWQYLLDDLEVERQCSAELEKAMLTIASDYPEIVVILQRIDKEKHKHRDEIRKMLMRIPRPCGQPPSVRRVLYRQ